MKKDLIPVIIAYGLALGLAYAVLSASPYQILISSFLATIAATSVIIIFSRSFKNSSFYDAYWSVFPAFIAIYWLFCHEGDAHQLRGTIVTGLVVWWSLRLTSNWAGHWRGLTEEDWRYQPMRDNAGKYELLVDIFGIHIFPTLIVFAALLPVHAAINLGASSLGLLDCVAIVITAGAILIETISDLQLHKFNKNKKPGDVLQTGLWRYSRHPNYFGEFGFWFGLMLFGLAAHPNGWWWILPGVIAMGCMFAFASIPMMDQRSLERRNGYAEYMEKTPIFFPWFPK